MHSSPWAFFPPHCDLSGVFCIRWVFVLLLFMLLYIQYIQYIHTHKHRYILIIIMGVHTVARSVNRLF